MIAAAETTLSLADLVLERGLVPSETLNRARTVQAETGERLDAVLTRLGLISEAALAQTIAAALGLKVATADDFPKEAVPLEEISLRFLRDSKAVPLRASDSEVEVAFVDPLDGYAPAALGFALGRRIAARVARASDVEAALDRLYGARDEGENEEIDPEADEADLERLKDLASDAPIVRAVNNLITRAAEARASDIHIEPTEDAIQIRFRIDGILREQDILPGNLKSAFISRIKVMSNLNIAERRLPQDGRLRHAVRGQDIDFRVATSPTIHGETVVLRILDRSNLALEFNTLGFDDELLDRFKHVLYQPHGILLVTGPTGSGKTTTLYASLNALNTPERKILTIEDPIEYRMPGINQTQVKPQIGLSFAAALRSFLRQDPDVMMVGEIRDLETAQVAIQSALTGHMILSTLHTNSAASSVTRLLDMGVEPFLITSTLNAVLAQRLVRRLCPACRTPEEASENSLLALGLSPSSSAPISFFHARGCSACGNSGFKGRVALFELLHMSDEIARLVLARAEAREIQRTAIEAGMRTMLADGIVKARNGSTTIEEVLRVTREA
ncbi:MAG: ATPase, T2SS/T4P/T4SS family [Rhizomicrobium sp.]|jgi:general secretion pathway protein E